MSIAQHFQAVSSTNEITGFNPTTQQVIIISILLFCYCCVKKKKSNDCSCQFNTFLTICLRQSQANNQTDKIPSITIVILGSQISKITQLTDLFMNTSSARKEGKMKPHFPRNIQQETLHPLPWSKGLLGFQFLK